MKNKRTIGDRPPLTMETKKQISDIMEYLNKDALLELSPKQTLDLIIDRAWSTLFPEKTSSIKRKKYQKFPF